MQFICKCTSRVYFHPLSVYHQVTIFTGAADDELLCCSGAVRLLEWLRKLYERLFLCFRRNGTQTRTEQHEQESERTKMNVSRKHPTKLLQINLLIIGNILIVCQYILLIKTLFLYLPTTCPMRYLKNALTLLLCFYLFPVK